ncbi:MAG: thiamine-phosphate kinase [Cyanobacteria bacterium SW_10_48_33]|nr:MAG: thiamine-phosphate kinase [Cyanobacteria bacterium QS_5_48_63]PSP09069.1 MAG: thiamine-phosphate kinase [Cyanobacteria bacterium SW_10_48_33]PSP19503.1 MAG: thiamine-phosphate kinase [Cyanobacteria bacterium SW_5_48_44]
MNRPPETVKDLTEQGILRRLQRFCLLEVSGDDAALLALDGGQSLVVTTDVLVERVHFSNRTTAAEDVGWRAAAANLSDLAAMGASPLGITVGLSLSGDVLLDWVERFYQGLYYCLQQYDTKIMGGDICRSSVITVSITAFGQVLPHRVIRRSSAQPGDAIVVTGIHGGSRAGLELLLYPEWGQYLGAAQRESLIRAHQRPHPRLDIVPSLWDLEEISHVAGMDSSDGLADAVLQICRASGVGAVVERHSIPLPPALTELVSPEQALEWALYGGEDFELVLCLPLGAAQTLVERLGGASTVVGQITTEQEVTLVDRSGVYSKRSLTLTEGFQHF